jgi:ABC-type cobalamin transport system ATPase subunit
MQTVASYLSSLISFNSQISILHTLTLHTPENASFNRLLNIFTYEHLRLEDKYIRMYMKISTYICT